MMSFILTNYLSVSIDFPDVFSLFESLIVEVVKLISYRELFYGAILSVWGVFFLGVSFIKLKRERH